MPKWQPGRYSVADFAANVQEFSARSQNRALSWTKIDDQTWRVQRQGNRTITVTYKVFGNDLSGTFAQLDFGHANYTGGEIFMYVAGHKPDPVELHVEPPSKLARRQRPHRAAQSARLEISELRNPDRQSDRDRSGLDGR